MKIYQEKVNYDKRGWLTELWRADGKTPGSKVITPEMAYASLTYKNVIRGPHEHKYQTDHFIFLQGLFSFRIHSKENIENNEYILRTFKETMVNDVALNRGRECTHIEVYPGEIHSYKCLSEFGLVLNFPDKLYNYEEPDEIRYED